MAIQICEDDIIIAGEYMLQQTYNKALVPGLSKNEVISYAKIGFAQLDMLYHILSGNFSRYDAWYVSFYELLQQT
jgi:hypothetical protein